ncbi:MAG: winged helix-turn-helix transcriptional regulator [Anaerolineae bacterium]|nr:winged helix-turn-helix transcriptional regulator [Anaerolineae bacterium]
MLRQILQRIAERGSWTTEELARELGTTTQMVGAMMGELARQGYIEPLGTSCGAACTACAQADRCVSGTPQRVWTARPDRRG